MPESLGFYREVLGFDEMGYAQPARMVFVSAGGYHHHIGLNSWMGEGAAPPPDSPGMRFFTVDLPDKVELEDVLTRAAAAGDRFVASLLAMTVIVTASEAKQSQFIVQLC